MSTMDEALDLTTMATDVLSKDSIDGKGSQGHGHGKVEVFEIDIEVTSIPHSELGGKTTKFGLSHSMIVIIAVAIILALLLLCCVSLLLMKRWRKKYYNCLQKGGEERCDPNCGGSRRPLLRRDKSADSISRTSNSSMRD
ncbi:uncharacterized protein LOC103317195 [Nasonia vitripennis]|uniref:Uncharacterized protein n=1 Tax=Nasonia vitripennis TaxID=7425 RepID=A0A7M7H7H4_NASVI|nr:uncharacterized protein LOC103317195 [Nasonia vitripennis]